MAKMGDFEANVLITIFNTIKLDGNFVHDKFVQLLHHFPITFSENATGVESSY